MPSAGALARPREAVPARRVRKPAGPLDGAGEEKEARPLQARSCPSQAAPRRQRLAEARQ